jgi:hypothetical protein
MHRGRDELGASLPVIEHDMTFLGNASDRLYCLDLGANRSCTAPV